SPRRSSPSCSPAAPSSSGRRSGRSSPARTAPPTSSSPAPATSPSRRRRPRRSPAARSIRLPRLPARDYVVVASILSDKRPELMLEALSVLGDTLVATESSNARALPAGDLASRAKPYFQHVEPIAPADEARSRALALAGPSGAVVVTGSLY